MPSSQENAEFWTKSKVRGGCAAVTSFQHSMDRAPYPTAERIGLTPGAPSGGEFDQRFFEGFDSGPGDDLWETNGTVSGTFAIGGIANAGVVGASAGGLGPIFDLAAFGDGVLFQGFDANSGYGLWTSNGTAAGTVEIGGLDNAGVTGAYSQGLDPSSLTVLAGQAIFLGDDSNYASKYAQSLWVTDGTISGTTEIGGLGNAGIADKYASGWNPAGFTAIGSEVFFTATDSVDYTGIWVTNGAAAGTIEIGGLKNAGIAGAPQPRSNQAPS
jgi:hypothetical protein